MARRKITYYFALTSTWAYVGYRSFADLVKRLDLEVDYRPLPLHDLFDATGGLPLPRRSPTRQNYRILELQRWREKLGLNFNPYPKHWPLHNSLGDRMVLAALETGKDIHPLLLEYFTNIWEKEANLEDKDTLIALADKAGFDGKQLAERAEAPEIEARYQNNLKHAADNGVYGTPSVILDGELFWGQDRLPLLEDAITSGRAPYVIPPRP